MKTNMGTKLEVKPEDQGQIDTIIGLLMNVDLDAPRVKSLVEMAYLKGYLAGGHDALTKALKKVEATQ